MDGISDSQNELNLILDQWEDRGVVKKEYSWRRSVLIF